MDAEQKLYHEHKQTLCRKVQQGEHIIGIAAGNGISAKYSLMGGCDFILALSSGKFRSMGCGSLAGYLSYANSNDLVMDYASKELLHYCSAVPVFFGLQATDPTRDMYRYIRQIRDSGFAGIVNYPTVGMIDGQFRRYLEADGACYEQEVEAIRFAHYCGLLTVAFVFDGTQAQQMVLAGADIVCAHFGLTSGGYVGAKKALTLEHARRTAESIFSAVDSFGRPDTIKVIYGGPVKSPVDAEYIYRGCGCQGYIGGSVFERTPVESAVLRAVRSFKDDVKVVPENRLERILFESPGHYDYVEFIKEYIRENYAEEIQLTELAESMHLSPSYLSTLFKNKVGRSFKSFLVEYRMTRARELISEQKDSLLQIAQQVGYLDYAHFSKMYKKVWGVSPSVHSQNKN